MMKGQGRLYEVWTDDFNVSVHTDELGWTLHLFALPPDIERGEKGKENFIAPKDSDTDGHNF